MYSFPSAQYSVLTCVQKPTMTSLLILSVIRKFTTLGLHSDISLEANLGTSKFCAVLSGSLSFISSGACHQFQANLIAGKAPKLVPNVKRLRLDKS